MGAVVLSIKHHINTGLIIVLPLTDNYLCCLSLRNLNQIIINSLISSAEEDCWLDDTEATCCSVWYCQAHEAGPNHERAGPCNINGKPLLD